MCEKKLVHTTHEWIAYKAMVTLPGKWKQLFLKHVEKLLDDLNKRVL
ncbi:MAG: hypothetical protein ACP6IU_12760 [Candidatus Asgardarchaeia archaeon]